MVPISELELKKMEVNWDEEIFWNLRGPVNWFWNRYRLVNEVIVNKDDGMVPVSELELKSMELNWDEIFWNLREPVNRFWDRSRPANEVKDDGMVFIVNKDDGIVPVSELEFKEMEVN